MRAVDVGIGHDDDFVVAELFRIAFFQNTAAEGRDHRTNFIVFKNPGLARLFNI